MARKPRQPAALPLGENPTGQALILTTLALTAMGVVMVHSALGSVARMPAAWYQRVDIRHTLFAAAGVVVILLAWRIDYRLLQKGRRLPVLATGLLAVSVIACALVYVPGIGYEKNGALRWIRMGPVGFQPSELLKVSLVIYLGASLTRENTDTRSLLRTFLPALGLVGAGVGLVIMEDFGTGLIIAIVAGLTMWLAGVPLLYLVSLIPPAVGAFWLLVVKNPNRWGRIVAMIDPWATDNRSSYQAGQSLIALLKGGWWGCGLGQGTRKLGFLPEDSTDFIFAVFCEEWGFIGAALLMGLLLTWIWFARLAALRSEDRFGRVLAGALGSLIAMQAIMHIAVVQVALPPTGIQFPFVSAGGTLLLLMSGAVALMVSVTARSPAVLEDDELATTAG
ncbi:MAG: FtsW/RodA/SpoVE family cell cycle protein [Phycisphaerae bacterium]